jgi:hypothetical protein
VPGTRGRCLATRVVEQVELVLDGDDRRQAELAEATEHAGEHVAAVGEVAAAVALLHGEQCLGERRPRPGHRHDGAGDEAAEVVRVAVLAAVGEALDQRAATVEQVPGRGKRQPGARDPLELPQRAALAAQDAVEVRQQQLAVAQARLRATQLRDALDDVLGHVGTSPGQAF